MQAAAWVPPSPAVSKWAAARQSPRCPACGLPVYPAEVVMASHRTAFHKWCVKCRRCCKPLTGSTLTEHKAQLYCSNCYQHIYMEKVTATHECDSTRSADLTTWRWCCRTTHSTAASSLAGWR